MISTGRRARDHRISRGGCRAISEAGRTRRRRSREPVTAEGGRVVFSGRITQHMKTGRHGDWLAAGATVLAAASWGILLSLLGG